MTDRLEDHDEDTDGAPVADTGSAHSRRVTMAVLDGRLSAVKRADADDPDAMARLRREAEVITSLSHPNAVELIGLRESDDGVELLLGAAGRHSLATVAPRSAASVAALAVDLLTLVTEFHDVDVTHGSIGADHVVVGPGGRLTLISWGRGTPAGSSAAEHAAGIRRDLAGLGATIAHLAFLLPDDLDRSERRRSDKLLSIASRLRDQPTHATAARAHDDLIDLSTGARRADPRRRPGRLPRFTRGARRPPAARHARESGRHDPPTPRVATIDGRRDDDDRRRAVPTLAAGVVALVGLWMIDGPPGRPLSGSSTSGDGLIAAVMEGVRVLAMLGGLYLIAISALCLAARYSGSQRLTRVADIAAPRWLRRAAVGLVGAGVVAGLAPTPALRARTEATTSAAEAKPPRATTSAGRAATTTTTDPPTTNPTTTDPAATDVPEVPSVSSPQSEQPSAAVDPPTADGQPSYAPILVVVESGDHLWGIAARALERHLGRPPTNGETDPYWRAVVDANRDVLVDPRNPDLLFRGQVLEVPPFDAA